VVEFGSSGVKLELGGTSEDGGDSKSVVEFGSSGVELELGGDFESWLELGAVVVEFGAVALEFGTFVLVKIALFGGDGISGSGIQ